MSLLKTVHFCIRPVWSEPSLSAWRNIGPLSTQWAHCEDSDQSRQTPRLIWVIAGRTVIYSNVGGNSRHESVMISVSKEDIELPKLKVYWIPQLHKNPYKQRYITGSVRCSTKPLSHTLTRILTNNLYHGFSQVLNQAPLSYSNKNPYKQRYITGSVRCSTKPPSHTQTRILTNNAISRVRSGAQPNPSLIL